MESQRNDSWHLATIDAISSTAAAVQSNGGYILPFGIIYF